MSERKAREFWIFNGDIEERSMLIKPVNEVALDHFTHAREVLPDDELERLRAENAMMKSSIFTLLQELTEWTKCNCEKDSTCARCWSIEKLKQMKVST